MNRDVLSQRLKCRQVDAKGLLQPGQASGSIQVVINKVVLFHAGPTVFPPQSGIVTPGFRILPGSMRPHLSSHF